MRRAAAGLREAGLITEGYLLPDLSRGEEPTKPPKVISLNADGVAYVEHHGCSEALFDRKPIARDWRNQYVQDPEIRHKIGTVECMMALVDCVSKFPSLEVAYMAPDFLTDDDDKSANKETYKGGALIPDIVASVFNKEKGRTRDFYIEFDRGTEAVWMDAEAKAKAKERADKFRKKGRARLSIPIADRFVNYDKFFDDKSSKTSETNPTLLWVCRDDESLRRIRQSDRIQWAKMPNVLSRTLLATLDHVKADFLGANWHVPASDEVMTVVELTGKDQAR